MTRLLDPTDDANLLFSLAEILDFPAVDIRRYFTSNMGILREVSEVVNIDISHFFNYVARKNEVSRFNFADVFFENVTLSTPNFLALFSSQLTWTP
ncbi:hypothetical protein [Brevibacillus sp. SIMBA_040]|uniref:hypothetical protein n=1 Tax=unclassified Brevibacillus TaxID=2684853 RepID=UPI00397A10EC